MSEQENLQLAKKWIGAVDAHDFAGWGGLRAPEYRWDGPGLPGPAGPEAEDAFMQAAYQAYPDMHIEVLQTVAQGDLVVVNGLVVGTNTGPISSPDGQTTPATGNKVSFPFSETLQFAGDKVVHRTMYSDRLTQMSQLGLVPQT